MGNLGKTFKKFLQNKNTVTILGVIIGVVVLYLGYNYRVKQAVTPVSIPIAKTAIGSRTEITADMIEYVEVSSGFVSKSPNLITSANQLIGRKVNVGCKIPQNGVFYTEQVVDEKELPDSAFADIPDGYTVFNLKVDNTLTYGNSIYPGNYIDLYLKGEDDNRKTIFAKFIKSIEVLDAKDSAGRHVFDGTEDSGTADVLLFAVPDDLFELLTLAEQVDFELIPVPRNNQYTSNPGETEVNNEYLKDLIISKSSVVPSN